MSKTTEELMNEIRDEESIEKYLSENAGELRTLSLSEYLNSMLEKYHVKKADLFRKAGLVGSNYGYELFQNDKKIPSRDILLSICVAFPMSIDEAQYALRCGGHSVLYARDERDAYILYGLKKKLGVDSVNELLTENGLKGLA
ncbi:MAG: hypothetical protein MJ114_01165 [Acetatifactor sp.]|nr:hypothetical protein [Acetatifactor sp.]